MIDFRYHLVSLVAVFLALTVGIVLGTTMLQDPLLNRANQDAASLREEAEELRVQNDISDQLVAGSDELLARYSDDVLDDRLSGTRIVILEAPGVDTTMRDNLADRMEQAGGTITGRVALTDAYIDPEETTLVSELTDQFSEGVQLPDGGVYQRAGTALAHAVLGARDEGNGDEGDGDEDGDDGEEDKGPEDDFDESAFLTGFEEGGLIGVAGSPSSGADIALLLTPAAPYVSPSGKEDPGVNDDPPPGNVALMELGLAVNAVGPAVIAGGVESGTAPTGIITRARTTENSLTTINVAGTMTGDVATVLTLSSVTEGGGGHWGIGEGVEGFSPELRSDTGDDEETE